MVENNNIQTENEKVHFSNFMTEICTPFSRIIDAVIKEGNHIVLSFKFDYDTLESWIHITDDEQEFDIKTPSIPTSIMSNSYVAQKAANAQRIIDSWFESLKESIEYQAPCQCKNLTVELKDTCVYSGLMVWNEYDKENENIYFVPHKYLREKHYDAYLKEKEFHENLHEIERSYESSEIFINQSMMYKM